jgi:hypothetical protein
LLLLLVPSWEIGSHWVGQEIPRILWNWRFIIQVAVFWIVMSGSEDGDRKVLRNTSILSHHCRCHNPEDHDLTLHRR